MLYLVRWKCLFLTNFEHTVSKLIAIIAALLSDVNAYLPERGYVTLIAATSAWKTLQWSGSQMLSLAESSVQKTPPLTYTSNLNTCAIPFLFQRHIYLVGMWTDKNPPEVASATQWFKFSEIQLKGERISACSRLSLFIYPASISLRAIFVAIT